MNKWLFSIAVLFATSGLQAMERDENIKLKLDEILAQQQPTKLKKEPNEKKPKAKYKVPEKYQATIDRKKETYLKRWRMSELLTSEICAAERIKRKNKKANVEAFVNALIEGTEISFNKEMLKKYSPKEKPEALIKTWFDGLKEDTKKKIRTIVDMELYNNGMRLIHTHARHCRAQAVKNLLAIGANPCITDNHGSNALHYLANYLLLQDDTSMFPTLKVLCKAGVNVNARDKQGKTPLDHAITRKKHKLVRALKLFNAGNGSITKNKKIN